MRSIFFQTITLVLIIASIAWITHNVFVNLAKTNTALGFGFIKNRAGFEIDQSLIPYTSNSSYGVALAVGLLNTLTVTIASIIPATIIGLLVGMGRLSYNKLISWFCKIYVEVFRNIPPLLVIFFWYKAVLSSLPHPRSSIVLPFNIYLNNRGFSFPKPILESGFLMIGLAFLLGIVISFIVARFARLHHEKTGHYIPVLSLSALLIMGLPILVFFAMGAPFHFDFPKASRFNLTDGITIGPEFISLHLALSFYTASFIAEIVRSGILSISRGQSEAAAALGFHQRQMNRLIIIPQAMRIIIPPFTSQYLNFLKNSSLAVAIGFADLVSVGGTILNQTGQAIEILAIWMSVYLSFSIMISLFMNWFNAKMALVEK